MNRRTFLQRASVGSLLLVSGCVGNRNQGVKHVLRTEPLSTSNYSDIKTREHSTLNELEKALVEVLARDIPYRMYDKTYIKSPSFIEFDERYLLITDTSTEIYDPRRFTAGVWEVENDTDTDSTIDYSSLPSIDQRAVLGSMTLYEHHEPPPDDRSLSEYRYAYPQDIDSSVLVETEELEHINYNGKTLDFDIKSQHVGETEHLYNANIWDKKSSFIDGISVNFDDKSLTEEEQKVLTEATENGEYTEGYVNWSDVDNRTVISDGYKSIIQRLQNETPGSISDPVIKFDGAYYRTNLDITSGE